jgi:hypothetical protein
MTDKTQRRRTWTASSKLLRQSTRATDATAGPRALPTLKTSAQARPMSTGTTRPAQTFTGTLYFFILFLDFILFLTDQKVNFFLRCYACVNIDYGKKYTELSYAATFTTDVDGNRKIDCSGAAQSDGEHICQCDAAFAERIAFNDEQCQVRLLPF